jgi:hypothetical protein
MDQGFKYFFARARDMHQGLTASLASLSALASRRSLTTVTLPFLEAHMSAVSPLCEKKEIPIEEIRVH